MSLHNYQQSELFIGTIPHNWTGQQRHEGLHLLLLGRHEVVQDAIVILAALRRMRSP